mgnify:FL=1
MNLAVPFLFASLGAGFLSFVVPGLSAFFGQAVPPGGAGLHISSADVAVWLQSGGVVGVLVWVVKTQLAREKEQQERYSKLLETHDRLHSQVATMLQTTSMNMASLTEAIRAMKLEIRTASFLRAAGQQSTNPHGYPPVDDTIPPTTAIRLETPPPV